MTFDLGQAMRRKGEFETARLVDFEFRCRARATRALIETLGLDAMSPGHLVATNDEQEAIASIAATLGLSAADVEALYRQCLSDARIALIAERGDPTPHRMA